jgi:hypothetical protein
MTTTVATGESKYLAGLDSAGEGRFYWLGEGPGI